MFFRGISRLLLSLLACFSTPVLGQPPSSEHKPSIVASIRPLGLLAQEISGEYGHVTILTEGSYSAHHYQLSISQRRQLAEANVVLWVGKTLESFLAKPISNRQTGVNKVLITASALPGIQSAQSQSTQHDHHHHDDHHEHTASDPHIWLNPANNHIIVDALVAQLSAIAPDHADYYYTKGLGLKQALTRLDSRLSLQMAALRQHNFIVVHPAYNHFIGRYGLAQIDYVSLIPEQNAGAKHLYHLRQQQSARCIFEDAGIPSKAARQLAKDLGIPMATLDPLGVEANSMVELIQTIGVELQRCLAERK